jgi:hypothetical protein
MKFRPAAQFMRFATASTPSGFAGLLVFCALALTGCAGQAPTAALAVKAENQAKQARLDQALALFSTNAAGGLPAQWAPLALTRKKKPTEYQLVEDAGKVVLRAYADQASSGLRHEVNIDVAKKPWLSWRWKTSSLIAGADNTRRETEDSPVRIVLAFDGDHDKLSLMDTILFDTAKLLTGYELPYATLMYVWENQAPVGTVIANTRTGRIQMIVAESGGANIGKWMEYKRNIALDYEKAFGEKPGRLLAVGVLSDTDNTGEKVEAWYGDIRLLRQENELLSSAGD